MTDSTIRQKQDAKFHKETFDRTSEDRRLKILEVAIDEFASKGYSATSINDIARKSNISIGAMYSYFASKEDLFLTIVNRAYMILEDIWKEVAENSSNIFEYFERMLITIREYGIKYAKLNQIYMDITTQALSQMSGRLSNKLETVNARYLSNRIAQAKEKGEIRDDINENAVAYCIDNLFMMYQFSFSSDYYKERMRVFFGEEGIKDIDHMEQCILKFISSAVKK